MIANPLPATRPAATVTISRGAYRSDDRSWPDAYKISNPDCELVIVPQIGRIMRFSAHDSQIQNVLWQAPESEKLAEKSRSKTSRPRLAPEPDEWINYGGDKVWPWPQENWPRAINRAWPPPDECSKRPHMARQVSGDTVRLISPALAALGFRIVRDITLAADACRATIVTRFERLHAIDQEEEPDSLDDGPPRPPCPWAVWSVTQVVPPTRAVARLDTRTLLPRGMRQLEPQGKFSNAERDDDLLFVELPVKTKEAKLGFDGDAIAAVYEDDIVFTQKRLQPAPGTAYEPRAKFTPGEAVQLYASKDYTELELTSPRHMNSPELRVEWELQRPRNRSIESIVRSA